MSTKGFDANVNLQETPNLEESAEGPLKTEDNLKKRDDINVLTARAKAIQDKENAKNRCIFFVFVIAFGVTGVFFTI